MICFIAPDPQKVSEKEGYMKRVAAIDDLFEGLEKVYFSGGAIKENAYYMAKAEAIYVHSIYMAEQILPLYKAFGWKIVTDLHGAVPEEEAYRGDQELSNKMAQVEAEVFKYSRNFVAVSQAMVDHFTNKYKLDDSVEWTILPIFDSSMTNNKSDRVLAEKTVIYTGGMQSWQKPELMAYVAKRASGYKFTFCTFELETMRSFLKNEKVSPSKYLVTSGQKGRITSLYNKSTFGLVLRDESVVNRIACPTKLIEYMSNGVVPIVSYTDIGDFPDLGYKYFTIDKIIKGDITLDGIKTAVLANYKVMEGLRIITERGVDKLRNIVLGLARTMLDPKDEINVVIEQLIGTRLMADDLSRANSEINRLRIKLEEQQSTIDSLREANHQMLTSRRWMFGDIINNPSNIVPLSIHILKTRRIKSNNSDNKTIDKS